MIVLTAATGYYLAIPVHFEDYCSSFGNILLFLFAMVGTALTSAGSCVLNNYFEREHDQQMKRTVSRALPSGIISAQSALLFGIVISLLGLSILYVYVNIITAILSLITIFSYVFLYTPLKRKTKLSLYAGTLPGALPALGGFIAYTGEIGLSGTLLFLIVLFWQIPHFLALAWIYRIDYKQAGFKMHTYEGDSSAKRLSILSVVYTMCAVISSLLLWQYSKLGFVYLLGALLLSLFFLYACIQFMLHKDNKSAKLQLYASYAYLSGIFLLVFVNKQL